MAGVIRKEALPRTGAFSFADLERQGRAVIAAAQAQAHEILAAARRDAATIADRERQKAHADGLAAGRAAGLEQIHAEAHAAAVKEARQDIASLATSLGSALTEFDQHKRGLIAAAESGLIELALQIARRVCKLEAGHSTAAALANARTLLDVAQHAEDAELCFNPAEFEFLKQTDAALATIGQRSAHVQLVADEGVERGGCRLRTRAGHIDAALDLQLQRIAEALRVDSEEAVLKAAPAPANDSSVASTEAPQTQ